MNITKLSKSNTKIISLSILILLVMLLQSFLVLSKSNALDPYSNTNLNYKSTECNPSIDTSTIAIQKMTDQSLYMYDKLIPNNFDITAIDINSKEQIIYILGTIDGNELDKELNTNIILTIDTKLKKVNKIMIDDHNLELENIVFDEMDNRLYLSGLKFTKNNESFVENDIIYLVSLPGEKQEILFDDIYTGDASSTPQNNDEIDIVDIDVGTKSNNVYAILNENIDTQNNTSASQYQLINSSHITNSSKSQIYIIPFGNAIVNSPDQKVNYVLLNGIKSNDKDVIFALNETTGNIIKNYSLTSLNSRELSVDSKKGKLYVLGNSFAYNDKIKGFSKQCEIITSIDTVDNNITTLSLGDFIVKDFIENPKNDVFYIIGKNDILNDRKKSNDNYLLELDSSTGTTKNIVSIPLSLDHVILNEFSNTIFVFARDFQNDQNRMFSIDLHKK